MLDLIAREPKAVYKPLEPSIPVKKNKYYRSIDLKYGYEYSIKELKKFENVSLNDIRIKYTSSDNGCNVNDFVNIYYIEQRDNPDYLEQMRAYDPKSRKPTTSVVG